MVIISRRLGIEEGYI